MILQKNQSDIKTTSFADLLRLGQSKRFPDLTAVVLQAHLSDSQVELANHFLAYTTTISSILDNSVRPKLEHGVR